jgi:hypothetical protein
MATVANSAGEALVQEKRARTYLTPTGLLIEGDYTHPMKVDVKEKILFLPLAG